MSSFGDDTPAATSPVPRLSVVLATFNRADVVRETLDCLAHQTLAPRDYEVIVVDDGSSDGTAAAVEAFKAGCPFSLTYLHHPNRGPGYTQNRGIRLARAPIILLMADDIFLEPGALAAHLNSHARHPEQHTAILGRVLQSPRLTQSVFLAKWDPFRLGGIADDQPLPYHMFWACNVSVKREFMLSHGMFLDERGRAGAASHEDVELGYRLHRRGLQLYFARDALGHHYHVETLDGTVRRSYQRGLNWQDFRRRVPEPEIDIRYRVYTFTSLLNQWRRIRRDHAGQLLEGDDSLPRLLFLKVARGLLFNRVTVPGWWMPLFAAAERMPWIAAGLRENMYRGVMVFYFLKGCRDGEHPQGLGGPDQAVAKGANK